MKAVPRQSGMNKTEARYADLLTIAKGAGEILDWKYEAVTFKLGPDLRYTPDFFVVNVDWEVEFHETKGGFIREDAWQKLKTAAGMFDFRFILCQWTKEKGWTKKIVGVPKAEEPIPASPVKVKHVSVQGVTPSPKPTSAVKWRPGERIPDGYALYDGRLIPASQGIKLAMGEKIR